MAYARQDILDLLQRNTDEGWFNPLSADVDSAALLNALADIGSRMSVAVDRDCDAGLISRASPGTPGTSLVTISKGAGTPFGTLAAGTVLTDSRGFKYVTLIDLPVPAGAYSATISVESLRRIDSVNTVDDPDMRFDPVTLVADASYAAQIEITTTTPHGFIAGATVRIRDVEGNTNANGVFQIGLVPTPLKFVIPVAANAAYTAGGIVQAAPLQFSIDSSQPVFGGAAPWLTVLGRERGVIRQGGEADGDYRARVRNIPDAVSPRAVAEAVQYAAQAVGLPETVVLEPFEDGSTLSLDQDLGLGSFQGLFFGGEPILGAAALDGIPFAMFWDDQVGELQDLRDACAYFRIQVQDIPEDPSPSLLRAFFDDVFFDDPFFAFTDVIDHPQLIGALMAVYQAADTKRAACVQFDEVIQIHEIIKCPGDPGVSGSGDANSVPDTVVWAASPPAGKKWWVQETVSGHVAAPPSTYVATATHKLRFTFEDATTFTTAAYAGGQGAQRLDNISVPILASKRVTMVEGILGATGGQTQRLIATLRVLQVSA